MNEEKQESTLTYSQWKSIADVAAQVAIEQYNNEVQRRKQDARDKRLKNTKMLLEKYRGFVIHSMSAIYNAKQIDDDYEFETLLELMGCGDDRQSVKISSIQESAAKTRILVLHIDRMIDYFRHTCESSQKPEYARRYRVIKGLYIDEEEKTAQELADLECIDISTIYKDVKAATNQLSALIFGYFE